mmetsp:Transcript_15276/g.22862  ORF Transcript_15276/g.22862 Transcript_15276/m.22862 type:complete len:331 (-) Transcript_15276:66-1058(-)
MSTSNEEYQGTVDIKWDQLDKTKLYTYMPIGSMCIRLMIYPLQLVKTRLQAQDHPSPTRNVSAASPRYRGTMHAFAAITREEGVRALYQGFFTNSLGMLIGPVYMTALEYSRHKWDLYNNQYEFLEPGSFLAERVVGPCISGAMASFAAQTLGVPIDVITQHQMVQDQKKKPKSPIVSTIIKRIYREQGLKGFFRGYTVSLLTYIPGSAITWGTYHASRYGFEAGACRLSGLSSPHQLHPLLHYPIIPLAGFCGGATSAILTNPLDVIRTRFQLNEASEATIRSTVTQLIEQDGMGGFARGVSARIFSSGLAMSCVMGMYELLKYLAQTT